MCAPSRATTWFDVDGEANGVEVLGLEQRG